MTQKSIVVEAAHLSLTCCLFALLSDESWNFRFLFFISHFHCCNLEKGENYSASSLAARLIRDKDDDELDRSEN
jgi:hypothetical protein